MTGGAAVEDPRIVRTKRDVIEAVGALLLEDGWDAVTHAAVAGRSGYAKGTIYAHWPTRLDLVSASIEQICDTAQHPAPTGDLRADLRASLLDFATDLSERHLDRLLAGVVERSGLGDVVQRLKRRLYETGTSGLRAILDEHIHPGDIAPVLTQLTGAVLVRVAFEGERATDEFVDDLIRRVLHSARPASTGAATEALR
ncbi:TetR/AcrR family transcriptional regulator [Micromonospora sp. NBC_01813]|uniref:TetR/AcrR family transcriptional regulator n=1 Tax=Micromonospora sp. NBC_01813 TaxID=2975988 RepID=UPI002DD97D8C|nr:TetR/AcrR family transcriptional regulator [Micromonospora sp. NBC_01813]WSA10745.1 TetR/AcrR family transcriptional regulator [Micromonospora sp. NBC_01813]